MDALPTGKGWQYEPKYDGFRCIAFRDGTRVDLQSKNQKPLQRYFPEVAAGLHELSSAMIVLDGELIIPGAGFETLQLRLHPAQSRILKLAEEHPARLVAFDLLAIDKTSLMDQPLAERRARLEEFLARTTSSVVRLGKATRVLATAQNWLGGVGLDGIVAKSLELPYLPGQRAMEKFKLWQSVDCVIGGVYLAKDTDRIESLLLGLYDGDGKLHYVGRCRVGGDMDDVEKVVKPLIGGQGFTGRSPGGQSRWTGKTRKPVAVRPELVVEVSADHITDNFMRHGARFLRWRPDKRPEDCSLAQLG